MRKIKFVHQDDPSGCGPACIAMIGGISYPDAVALIKKRHRGEELYTHWRHLRGALTELEVPYGDSLDRVRAQRWDAISTLSIVKCGRWGGEENYWHWVVYDGTSGLLYDPLKDGPLKPDGRHRKPRMHLPILG